MNSVVYSSKAATGVAEMKRGRVGWRKNENGEWEELIFIQSPKGQTEPGEWLPIQTYRSQKAEKSRLNVLYYRDHPELLAQKIREKKGAGRLSCGRGVGWDSGRW